MTDAKNEAASGASRSDAVLGADLERELRAAINPLYADVRGTESYERKRLIGEIDRLRAALRWHIRVYQVADEAWEPEAETDRLMALTLNAPNVVIQGPPAGGPAGMES